MKRDTKKIMIASGLVLIIAGGLPTAITYASFTKYYNLDQAISVSGTRYIYLKLGATEWAPTPNPPAAAHFFFSFNSENNSESEWSSAGVLVSGTDYTSSAIYQFELPTYDTIVFTRFSGGTSTPSWEGTLWNQTIDLATPVDDYCVFTISNTKVDSKYTGSWNAYP